MTDPGNPGNGNVYVIDPSTNTATSVIGVAPGLPPFTIPVCASINADESFAYVTNFDDSPNLYRIDTSTNTAVAVASVASGVPSFQNPQTVAISPDQTFAYMTDFNGGKIYYIDTATNTATKTIINKTTSSFVNPAVVAIAPNGQFAYVTDNTAPAVYYIDVASNTATMTVSASSTFTSPEGIAISPDNTFAYVADYGKPNIYKIDCASNVATATSNSLVSFANPQGIAISPDGTFALAADTGASLVYYIDTKTNATTNQLSVNIEDAYDLNSIAISPDGSYAYVGGGDSPIAIYKIDINSWTLSDTAPYPTKPFQYPSGPAMRMYPVQIATSTLTGNNLSLANYLNKNVPYTTRYPLIRLQGGSLQSGLEAVAPTRNTLSTFSAQIGQISLSRLVSNHVGQARWKSRFIPPKVVAYANEYSEDVASDDDYENDFLACAGDEFITLGDPQNTISASSEEKKTQVWLSGFGEYAHVRPGNQTPTFTAGSGGIVAAVDYSGLYPHPIGAGVAYAHTHIHEKEDAGYANIDQGDVFVYGLFQKGRWYFDTALWGGYYHTHNVRKISFQYYDGGHATSSIHGWQLSPHLEVGYDYLRGFACFEPFVMIDYVATWEGHAKEKGSTLYNFGQKARYCSLLRTESGLKTQQVLRYSVGTLTFAQKASYAYQKAFHTGMLNAFLVGAPGAFTVTTLTGAQNLGVGELEVIFAPKKDIFTTSLTFHTELGSSYQTYQGILELSKKF